MEFWIWSSHSTVFPGIKWPPLFADYSLMINLIEKANRGMNLGIYRVDEINFFHLNMWFYLGWD